MKSLLTSWFSVLASLGRTIVWKRSANRNRSIRRPSWELLEPRHLLTATPFGLEAVFNEYASIIDATSQSSVFSISNGLGAAEGEGGLTATAVAIDAVDDQLWSGVVATFHDSTVGTNVGDYVASIQWGEGNYGYANANEGSIESLGNGNFAVRGSFTYVTEANPTVKVTINRIQGSSIATETTRKYTVQSLSSSALV